MGYDETDSPRRDRGRNRQPVKRMGDRDIPYRRSKEPGHKEPGLNLITDSFRDQRRREPRAGRGGPGNVQTPGRRRGTVDVQVSGPGREREKAWRADGRGMPADAQRPERNGIPADAQRPERNGILLDAQASGDAAGQLAKLKAERCAEKAAELKALLDNGGLITAPFTGQVTSISVNALTLGDLSGDGLMVKKGKKVYHRAYM